jgi:hypothetical protein
MMNNDLRRMCMLLAAAGFQYEDLQELIYDIREANPKKIFNEFEKIHKDLFGGAKKINPAPVPDSATASRLLELLVNEAGLTVGQYFVLLEKILQETFPGRKIANSNPKAGFASWIRALNKEFSDSELLHVASRLRNTIVHNQSEQDDWVLRE